MIKNYIVVLIGCNHIIIVYYIVKKVVTHVNNILESTKLRMMKRNSLFNFGLKRFYRPSVSDSSHQEKILAVRAELAALGIATGRSKGRRNDLSAGTSGVSPREAIDRLREADFAAGEAKNRMIREEGLGEDKLVGPNSLLMNIQVKLLKEQ